MLTEVKKQKLEYEPQLLSTKELIDRYWGQCSSLFQKCIDKQMYGEMDVEDIYSRALKGEMFIIVIKNDSTEIPDVKLALALELVYYPKYTAMNVAVMGGSDLKNLISMFWKPICGWARVCGIKKMVCSVHPAMQRILESVGFEQQYIQLRQDITED